MFKKKPIKLFRHSGLYLAPVPKKGRGVFCTDDIAAGELIETSPLLILDEDDAKTTSDTMLSEYVFSAAWLPPAVYKREYVTDPKKASILVMGVSSFCNGQHDPNAELVLVKGHFAAYYDLKARRDIPKETEITVSYGLLWFAYRNHHDENAPKKAGEEPKKNKD